MPEKNILIADDEQEVLDILKEMIQREGYRVFLASNGKEAVEAIKINPIDLAILDIKMPVMDGIKALEEIKKIDQGIEVLIMTGYADLETLTQAISDHGAFDYILKPFKRVEILNGIQNALLKRDFASQKKLREKELEERILRLEKEFHERTHQLRESQIKYRDIVENSNDAIVVVQDGKLKFTNYKTAELTGYRQEELKDMSFLEMVHPENRDMVAEIYKSEDFPNAFSFRALRKSGESFWVETNAVSTIYEEKPATLNMIRDITERKGADEELKKSEERYRALVENSTDAILMMDNERRIVSCNRSFLDLFGYNKNELEGRSIRIIHQTDQSFHSFGETAYPVIDKVGFFRTEWEFVRKDGTILPVETVTSAIKSPDGSRIGSVSIIRDITERRQAEEALRRSNERLEKEHNQRRILSKRLIDLLEKDRHEIAMELHDHIGQILTSLKMNLEMIRSQLKPTGTELGSQIKAAEKKAIQALKDIKNVSYGLKPGMLDALGLVSSLRELLYEIQRHTNIQIQFFHRDIPKRFTLEKELALYRITQEGLTNIVKHAQAKKVFVNLIKKDEVLSLSIEDDGVGFDVDKAMTISKRKGPLGLFIMRERAEQLDGEFTIESQIGKGTHLLVQIPL